MGKGGRKYRLLIYEYMLNRWWPKTLLLAITIFVNVGMLWGVEWYYSANPAENPLPILSEPGGTLMLAVGAFSLLVTLFLLVTRKMAYVRCFDDHLLLTTPFLRMNISYKRIQRSVTAQMYSLFPPKSLSSWNRDLIRPVSGSTVIVVHLLSYPLPRAALSLFLSPFFFYDKSTHFVLLISDWMGLSTELDSRRSMARYNKDPHRKPPPRVRRAPGLLDDLKRK